MASAPDSSPRPVLALPLPRVARSASRIHVPAVLGSFQSLLLHSVTLKRLSVDVEVVIQELVAAADASADGRSSITYDQFVSVIDGLDPGVRAMLTATVFSKMPKDERGAVPIIAIARYLRQRMALRGVFAKMQAYDVDRDGCLSEQELENMVFDSIPHVPDLAALQENFYPFYVFSAVRKFFFTLDVNHSGRIPLDVLATSSALAEWMRLLQQGNEGGAAPNWFSAANALRVYRMYLELDLDQNGMLSLSEFRNFNGGSLTEVFCRRLFEECHTYAGEMDFKAFLDFVLASENRALPQSQRYMFRLFDLTRSGYLTRTDVKFLMRAVLDKLVSEGHDRLDTESVVDEVLDMVKPAVPSTGITLRDLQLCKVGHIITLILSDSVGFWTYDNRESLMQAPPLFADVATEGSASSSSGEREGSPGGTPQSV